MKRWQRQSRFPATRAAFVLAMTASWGPSEGAEDAGEGGAGAARSGPWRRHAVEAGHPGLRGADGVRLGDVDGDGRPEIVTGWEESGVVRAYRHPGPAAVRDPWPAVTVGEAPAVEDACFVDFDRDGAWEVLTCCEGATRRIFLHHRAPDAGGDWFDESGWRRTELVGDDRQWMFALPVAGGFVAGAKGKGATVTRFEVDGSRVTGRHDLVEAGWIMSLLALAGEPDRAVDTVLVTDRKGPRRGLHRISLDPAPAGGPVQALGGEDLEVMFAAAGDVDHDGIDEVVVATRNGRLVIFDPPGDGESATRWRRIEVPNPFGIEYGKAVAVADIDLDGRNDLVLTANTQRQQGKPGVVWLRQIVHRSPDGVPEASPTWAPHDVSGPEGDKFDLVEAIDLDGDGDLDLLTCEEAANLGVIWYENPSR